MIAGLNGCRLPPPHWPASGEIDRTSTAANSFGVSLQATGQDFGRNNRFVIGASV
jgi:hypothetical protein